MIRRWPDAKIPTVSNNTRMCLITFFWQPHAEPALVLAANRDEFHGRPSRALNWWRPDGARECILAGRDEVGGGTWLGVTRSGRFAAVTNLRRPDLPAGESSRGRLPVEFLVGGESPEAFMARVRARREDYGPFNLLVGTLGSLWYAGTGAEPVAVPPGPHGLSNALLDTPWPKVERARAQLLSILGRSVKDPVERLVQSLADTRQADEAALPDTGIGKQRERLLSPPFIITPDYGTRSSSVLLLGSRCELRERSFDARGLVTGERQFGFRLGGH